MSDRFHVEPGSGRAFTAAAGQVVTFLLPDGPQVVDVNVFNRDDPRERFGSSVTRPIFGTHLTTGGALLSCPPWERVLAHVVADSVSSSAAVDGARVASHDLLYGRCSRALRRHMYGSDTPGCQEILAAAIAEHGLTSLDVHDPFNVFMTTGIDTDGNLFFVSPAAGAGDHLALRMEIDVIVAVSACPGQSSGLSPRGMMIVVDDGP